MASSNLSVPVLLGVSDEPVSSDQTDFTTNKFGGPCDPISPSVLKDYQYFCKCCNQVQILICQLYCPLAASPFHRTLYILACVSKSCWNKSDSWRGLRGQSLAQDTSTKIENATKSDPMFDVDDDWGDAEDDATSLFTTQKSTELAPMVTAPCHDCNDSESESDVASETTDDIEASLHDLDLKEESTQEVLPEDIPLLSRIQSRCVDVVNNNDIPEENHTVFQFKPFYVACVTEDHFDSALDDHVQKLLLEYKNSDKALEKEEATQISSAVTKVFDQENHEKYEKGVAKHGDVVFQSFVDRVALCPSQILRYSWGGLPLLMSPLGEDSASSLICPNCGHGKVFELQIMPTLVHLLRCEGDADGERSRQSLDFGTVLVYSCRASCWNAENPKLVEETIVVQSEPGSEF